MHTEILDGLSLVDAYGRLILAAIVLSLLAGVGCHVFLATRYAHLERDLEQNADLQRSFSSAFLDRVAREARDQVRHSREANLQAIVENAFQSELRPLLLYERYVRAATGLVLILGLLGTFYGLTLSIGKLVHLVSADPEGLTDLTQAVTHGLTQALAGMAVAFSNSLVGIVAAVILTVLNIVFSVTDRRTALTVQVETYLDRQESVAPAERLDEATVAALAHSIARLEGAVVRFEGALLGFAERTSPDYSLAVATVRR